jgi:hypothetical protein
MYQYKNLVHCFWDRNFKNIGMRVKNNRVRKGVSSRDTDYLKKGNWSIIKIPSKSWSVIF